MKRLLFVSMVSLCSFNTHAQYILKLSIKNSAEKTQLAGATVIISSINRTVIADSLGIATFADIAPGKYTIKVSYVGLEEQEVSVIVPLASGEPIEVSLERKEHEEEVVVTATRTSRSISDIPTRVETISGEELTEKGNMKPGDIRMMLNES